MCGDGIEALLQGAALELRVRQAAARGVEVVACGMTLTEKQIPPERLNDAVRVVPNGLLEAVRLQEAGYLSVEL